jgi:hypothetical protein
VDIGTAAPLQVTVRNHSDVSEDLVLDVWVKDTYGQNHTVVNNYLVSNIASLDERILSFNWDTTGHDPGVYSIHAHVTILGHIDDNPENNTCQALAELLLSPGRQAADEPPPTIPEANTMMLLGGGLAGLGGYIGYLRRRMRKP